MFEDARGLLRFRRDSGLALALSVAVAALGACSSDTSTPAADSWVPADSALADQLAAVEQGLLDQSTPDQSAPDQASSDGQLCSVVGKWQGSGDGVAFTIEFLANGKSDYTVPAARTHGGGGTWSIADDELSWQTDRQDCDAVPATYRVSFSADCSELTFTAVQDACGSRKLAYDGATFPRI